MTIKEILENLTGGRPAWPDGTGGAKADLSFDIALVVRLVISCIIFSGALLIRRIPAPWPSVMLIVSALIAGADLLAGAILAVMNGRFLDKSVLVLLSTVIAFIFGAAVEGAALVLLFQLGGIFISYAVVRTRIWNARDYARTQTASLPGTCSRASVYACAPASACPATAWSWRASQASTSPIWAGAKAKSPSSPGTSCSPAASTPGMNSCARSPARRRSPRPRCFITA